MIVAPEVPANAGGNDPGKNATPKNTDPSGKDTNKPGDPNALANRRRPGRAEYICGELVDLLRESASMRDELQMLLRESIEYKRKDSFLKLITAAVCMWATFVLFWFGIAKFFN